jgi:LysR family hydrogen peroxide-inducible transcriptional activator
MTLTELRYIIAVAREQHFGRAAETCFVSQPTLSVAVRKLEEELGVQLFERNAGDVRTTSVGESVVAQAQRTLEAAESVKQIAGKGKNQLSEPLKLGAIHTVGPYLFPEMIPALRQLAPNMSLIVEEGYTAVLAEKLKRGELDVLILALPFDRPGLLTVPLYTEPFITLLPASHPLTAKDYIAGPDLAEETLLLLGAGHCFRDQVIDACPECAPRRSMESELQKTIEGSSLETIRHMVVSGLGVTILPCTAAGADRYSQRLVAIRRFMEPSPSRTLALAWRVSFPRPKVIDVLKEAVSQCSLSCVTFMSN